MADQDASVDSILCGAIEIGSSEDRDAFIAQACGPDEELRRRVQRVIDARVQAGSSLESPPGPATLTAGSVPESARSGTVIGSYQLLQPLGEGGMGTVYMAEQTQPVRRTVALKLIKAGMDSRQVLARFGAERQALALMDHPNIAKFLDAGTTEPNPKSETRNSKEVDRTTPVGSDFDFRASDFSRGRPYFVMELVKGVPITTFCDERRLTLRERLELFVPVCQAVQHAHQKGIIHRDLKPSNVLVALYDGKPVPKVIDFGVAKATGPRLTDQTLYTEFGAVVGTLEYMSPEQAELNQLDIDTRSDIYSLGVMLYELLTGSTPLEHKRLKSVLFLEVLRLIREEESERPSDRLSTTDELPSIAACRHVEPRKLRGLVRGELDWIVMKALEKDRNRRYETANGLAADLRRYLDDEPVQACPPSVHYRLSKLAQAPRGPGDDRGARTLAAARGGGERLAGGRRHAGPPRGDQGPRYDAPGTRPRVQGRSDGARGPRPGDQGRRRGNQLGEASPNRSGDRQGGQRLPPEGSAGRARTKQNARDRHVTVEAVLNKAAARIAGKFDDNPEVEAAIRQTVGDTYMELGLYPEGQPHLERTLELRRRVLGPEHPDTLTSMSNLAVLYRVHGQYERSETLQTQALEVRRRVLGPEHPDTLTSMNNLATLYKARDQYEKAETLHSQALEILRRVLGPEHPDTLTSMSNLAELSKELGHYEKAEALHTQALELRRRVPGPEHPSTLSSLNNLALLYHSRGQDGKAEPLFQQALEIERRVLGSEHPGTLTTTNNLALVYDARGQYEKAEPLFTQTLEIQRRVVGPEHPNTLTLMNNLARLYEARGQYEKARLLCAGAGDPAPKTRTRSSPNRRNNGHTGPRSAQAAKIRGGSVDSPRVPEDP